MLRITDTEVYGWEAAIRGMRNPMNSWEKSDSIFFIDVDYSEGGEYYDICGNFGPASEGKNGQSEFELGVGDRALMMKLAEAGPVHAKYRRMITVTCDITAPLYWWKEFDTYKVGTVANSCSTMHKIHASVFTLGDFSREHLIGKSRLTLIDIIEHLNFWRDIYVRGGKVCDGDGNETVFKPHDKEVWWQMIQLLPSSYNQRRTVLMNYEVLSHIYPDRKEHKLDEWHTFCEWVEGLPHSEIITLYTEVDKRE